MEARRLVSLIFLVTGLLASPTAALVIGARERRGRTRRGFTEKTAVRMMVAAAVFSAVLVSVGGLAHA